jgi:hypothetical protein
LKFPKFSISIESGIAMFPDLAVPVFACADVGNELASLAACSDFSGS